MISYNSYSREGAILLLVSRPMISQAIMSHEPDATTYIMLKLVVLKYNCTQHWDVKSLPSYAYFKLPTLRAKCMRHV
jgi:hypothetical protein